MEPEITFDVERVKRAVERMQREQAAFVPQYLEIHVNHQRATDHLITAKAKPLTMTLSHTASFIALVGVDLQNKRLELANVLLTYSGRRVDLHEAYIAHFGTVQVRIRYFNDHCRCTFRYAGSSAN